MKPLSGLDASFLYLETPHSPMNVVGTLVLDPSATRQGFSLESLMDAVDRRLPGLPPLRRRLQEVPFGLGHPVWVEDPDVSAARHVRCWRAARPGSTKELADFVARVAARPLDRSRPLWELWVVEGLRRGRVGLVFKLHHAVADGVSASALLLQLLGATADAGATPAEPAEIDAGTAPKAPGETSVERAPSRVNMLGRALGEMTRRPLRLARAFAAAKQSADALTRSGLGSAAIPTDVPHTPWNRSISERRAVAYHKAPLRDVEAIRAAFGGTMNDVVLAACTQALRNRLCAAGETPTRPLVATVPVSVRTPEELAEFGNRISAMFVRLPVHLSDPLDQLLVLQSETRRAKRAHSLLGGGSLSSWAELGSPALVSTGARLYSGLGLADHHRPLQNLVISNVPGPPMPLYAAGARVVSAHPHGPIFDGAGLNITVLSYAGALHFGVLACRRNFPEVWDLAFGFGAALGDLAKLARVEPEELRASG